MSSMFATALRGELQNESTTENGALGYNTTGRNLLDLNFAVSSLRNATPQEIINKFILAWDDNAELALKWLFFARDVRGGMGERRLFRVVLEYLSNAYPEAVEKLIKLVPEYGRWDDLFVILTSETPIDPDIVEEFYTLIQAQLLSDMKGAKTGVSISLLAKWMPSVNTSSYKTRMLAKQIRQHMGLKEVEYRKMLSGLRKYLDIVERKMSAGEWDLINYSGVPSRANVIYNQAFWKHDEERRQKFIDAVKSGEAKINSGTNFPHDIVHAYVSDDYNCWGHISYKPHDDAIEALWDALPNYVPADNNVLVVADGSASMTTTISNTNVTALEVANALAIYFAERSKGQFANQYITFSNSPQLVDFSKADSLIGKLQIAAKHTEVANTDIARTFKLILDTAIRKGMTQADLPSTILVISDMEFDAGANMNVKLFEEIAGKFKRHGYKLPRLAFWNLCSRTGTIPITENENGFALVSGFSPTVLKMVLSQKLDAYEALVDILMSERYAPITI